MKPVKSHQGSHFLGFVVTSYFHSQHNHKIVGHIHVTKNIVCVLKLRVSLHGPGLQKQWQWLPVLLRARVYEHGKWHGKVSSRLLRSIFSLRHAQTSSESRRGDKQATQGPSLTSSAKAVILWNPTEWYGKKRQEFLTVRALKTTAPCQNTTPAISAFSLSRCFFLQNCTSLLNLLSQSKGLVSYSMGQGHK